MPSGESWPWSTRSGSAESSPRCSMRTSSSLPRHPLALEVPPAHPYVFHVQARYRWTTCRPSRTRACSAAVPTGRGPVWMPVNAMIIRRFLQFYLYTAKLQGQICRGSGKIVKLLRWPRGSPTGSPGYLLPAKRQQNLSQFRATTVIFYEYLPCGRGWVQAIADQSGPASWGQFHSAFWNPKRLSEAGEMSAFQERRAVFLVVRPRRRATE